MGLDDCYIWKCDTCGTEIKTSGLYKDRIPDKWFVLEQKKNYTLTEPYGHWSELAFWQSIYDWKQTEYFCSFKCLLQAYVKEESNG